MDWFQIAVLLCQSLCFVYFLREEQLSLIIPHQIKDVLFLLHFENTHDDLFLRDIFFHNLNYFSEGKGKKTEEISK